MADSGQAGEWQDHQARIVIDVFQAVALSDHLSGSVHASLSCPGPLGFWYPVASRLNRKSYR